MTWHVQYNDGTVDRVERHPTPELAIQNACRLLDEGHDVYGIGTGPLSDTIARDEIAKIYALWVREKRPFRKA